MPVLVAFEGVGIRRALVYVPVAGIAVVAGDIDQQPLLVFGAERVAVHGAAQGGGELGLHVVPLQPHTVVAGVSLLALV